MKKYGMLKWQVRIDVCFIKYFTEIFSYSVCMYVIYTRIGERKSGIFDTKQPAATNLLRTLNRQAKD